ncbi:hypothetical protein BDR26DRAFT_1007735 [Obelidium mucronatum]|nr:hypothetical protein BDR26DRAFT_1007735 [Obelidium mucronatum]
MQSPSRRRTRSTSQQDSLAPLLARTGASSSSSAPSPVNAAPFFETAKQSPAQQTQLQMQQTQLQLSRADSEDLELDFFSNVIEFAPSTLATSSWFSYDDTQFSPCFLARLPHEIIAKIYLLLPVPTILAAASRSFHAEFYLDPFLLATWLVMHNQFLPSDAGILRPISPVHPLLAAMKHSTRFRLVSSKPDVAEMLLRIEPFTSRYELQRMYRRALSLFNKCTDLVSSWGIELYGEEIRATVPFQKTPANPAPPPLPHMNAAPFLAANENALDVVDVEEDLGPGQQQHVPQNAMDAIMEHEEENPNNAEIMENNNNHVNPHQHATPSPRPNFPVDDRRLLLDAADLGDIATISHLLTNKALLLDPRVLADAFCRAWDNGDPFSLCTPHTGYLWPRCSASRYFVMEKIVQEEEEVVTVFLMQTQGGVPENLELGEEIVDTVVHGMKVCWELIEDERREDAAIFGGGLFYGRKRSFLESSGRRNISAVSRNCDVLLAAGILTEVVGEEGGDTVMQAATDQGNVSLTPIDAAAETSTHPAVATATSSQAVDEMEGLEYMAGMLNETVFRGKKKAIELNLWSLSRPFLQRAFDSFVAYGSVRMVALLLFRYSEWIQVKPCHMTSALDRASLPLCLYLVEYAGADPSWEEDVSLSSYVRKPSDPSIFGGPIPSPAALDGAGRTCWSWALRKGVQITERRWEGIVKLGPLTVGAVIDFFGPVSFDPCRDNMLGFRVGSAPVVRVLSKTIDARFTNGSKCVLYEAAMGQDEGLKSCALYFVSRLGAILADDLRNGDRERVMELLDAGAIVGDEAMLAAAAIADMPPGDWDEWPMAARCYRRVLVQKRLGLPIPSRSLLKSLPDNVVNTSFFTALNATRPIYCNPTAANVYSLYQRRRHVNAAGVRINLVPVLERDLAVRVVEFAMENLRDLLKMCDDPAYPGEAYCFIKGMLQYGLRDKNLLRDEDEFFLPDDEWDEVASSLTTASASSAFSVSLSSSSQTSSSF